MAVFFLVRPRPPTSTLFPYTTLFRSFPNGEIPVRRARLSLPCRQIMATTAKLCSTPFRDRKSTRLNSSHQIISYAVFFLKKTNFQADDALVGVQRSGCTESAEVDPVE